MGTFAGAAGGLIPGAGLGAVCASGAVAGAVGSTAGQLMDGHLDASETLKQAAIGCVTAGATHGAFKAIKGLHGAGVKDPTSSTPESEPPAAAKPDSPSGSAAGKSSAEVGALRELTVARITGERRVADSGEPVFAKEPNVGKVQVDVIGPNGEYIYVGGPAKAFDLPKLGNDLRVYKYAADQAGVRAQAYFEFGTPESVLIIARRQLGAENVFTFTM